MPRVNHKAAGPLPSSLQPAGPDGLWIIDLIKALAAQLIVWHHFVSYGPLVKTLSPYAPRLVDWLFIDARMAVQAFLVVGGFLAARSLSPRLDSPSGAACGQWVIAKIGQRYLRLIKPYVIALALAVACAALARAVLVDPDTPAAPSLRQIVFHLLLIHDITGTEALSTGVWYVAADLQLYALFLFLLWLAPHLAQHAGLSLNTARAVPLLALAALSLFWANRSTAMEVWALYFFAAYALGIATQWAHAERGGYWTLAGLLLLYAFALGIDWRERLLVSLFVASLLLWGLRARHGPGQRLRAALAWLSGISYWVFLIHYPLVLIVGALTERLWPGTPVPAALGLLSAWTLTLGLAHALQRAFEAPGRGAPAP